MESCLLPEQNEAWLAREFNRLAGNSSAINLSSTKARNEEILAS